MTTGEMDLHPDKATLQRARLRTVSRRRRRLLRRTIMLAMILAAMVVVSLINRDTQQIREEREHGESIAAALQEDFESRRRPPLRFPDVDTLSRARGRYYFNLFYVDQKKWHSEVGVCCLKTPVRLFVRAEGRIVILYDGKQYRSQWIPEIEFCERAAELGLTDVMK